MRDVYIYRHNILVAYQTPHSESFLIYKFDLFENHYDKEMKGYKVLHFKKDGQEIIYNSKEYYISERRGDTLVCETNSNHLIAFCYQ
jgi:hypothetical protein